MNAEQRLYCVLVLACLILLSSSTMSYAQLFSNLYAELPALWINHPSLTNTMTLILWTQDIDGISLVCGFNCDTDGKNCIFGVFISRNRYPIYQHLAWSANRKDPVQANATLRLSQDGNLILTDSDGRLVWSSHTGGSSVAGMKLTESGNLVLFGSNNETIWQSFDYPIDSLLLGQKLMEGQKLIASGGLFYLCIENQGLAAYINSNPPQRYYFYYIGVTYVEFTEGRFINDTISSAAKFVKLGPDGHLRAFQPGGSGWIEAGDLFRIRSCEYPTVCGTYGLCSSGVQCGCIQGNLFPQKNSRQPNVGCSLVAPVSCDPSEYHTLLELNSTYYFAFTFNSHGEDTLVEDCKIRCLNNCSCKAALFAKSDEGGHNKTGSCLLLNEVLSMANRENSVVVTPYSTTMYIKVQHPYSNASKPLQYPHSNATRRKTILLASSLSATFGVIFAVASCIVFFRKVKKWRNEAREDYLENVPGMPTRYSYLDLKSATKNFGEKLGQGGFGSVYAGKLSDGRNIAVKCLDGLERVKDSFLVEVKTIGSIRHVNLVELIGFCFEKSHRLLVFEHMANRSLDGWIFGEQDRPRLPWDTKKRIISEIAKGLAYLHEECSQKIIHLDIKPQNILLDENFSAKIGDFGLSKLIEKDQSRVVTRMRGTPGYLAPEWLSSVITEKVDVYSFGIVVLEMICGRRNLDRWQPEEDRHLLSVFKRKAEERKLEELVDGGKNEEAVKMMRVAAWCLQGDFTRRPSMSTVVKVLEGLVEAETDLDYDFLNPTTATKRVSYGATELPPSALSGPR